MLRRLSAALLATALIAGPAFAADSTSNANTEPAAAASHHAVVKPVHKTAKTVKHIRQHVVRHTTGKKKTVRASKTTRMHRHHIALHKTKPGKTDKTNKTSKLNKASANTHG